MDPVAQTNRTAMVPEADGDRRGFPCASMLPPNGAKTRDREDCRSETETREVALGTDWEWKSCPISSTIAAPASAQLVWVEGIEPGGSPSSNIMTAPVVSKAPAESGKSDPRHINVGLSGSVNPGVRSGPHAPTLARWRTGPEREHGGTLLRARYALQGERASSLLTQASGALSMGRSEPRSLCNGLRVPCVKCLTCLELALTNAWPISWPGSRHIMRRPAWWRVRGWPLTFCCTTHPAWL